METGTERVGGSPVSHSPLAASRFQRWAMWLASLHVHPGVSATVSFCC